MFILNLTRNEKKTFFSFFGLYLGGSFILLMIIVLLYYQNEKKLYFDLTKTKMENIVSNISSQIIYAHMSGTKLDSSKFMNSNEYRISFYDNNKNKLFGNLDETIDFSKKIMIQDKNFILVNDATYGHLGVYYIAIEENLYSKTINKLKENIFFLFIFIYTFISLIGFYLAKLFLTPIKEEREKLNDFIKDTTHELNTPISAILMSSENETLSKKQIERIQLSVKKISEIYKDLTYLFLEENEKKHNLKPLNIKAVIEEQLKYFEVLAEKKRIVVNKSLENFEFEIEKNDFIRVFNNIISNAIKYNKPKGSINIQLKNKKIIVQDTGIGIDGKKLNDIFKRYYRATNEHGGFGLGLNIVKKICDTYFIKIEVNSELKKGTTFIFTFN